MVEKYRKHFIRIAMAALSLAMILVVGIAVVSILLFSRHRVIPLSQPGDDGPLIDAITEDEP